VAVAAVVVSERRPDVAPTGTVVVSELVCCAEHRGIDGVEGTTAVSRGWCLQDDARPAAAMRGANPVMVGAPLVAFVTTSVKVPPTPTAGCTSTVKTPVAGKVAVDGGRRAGARWYRCQGGTPAGVRTVSVQLQLKALACVSCAFTAWPVAPAKCSEHLTRLHCHH
jgi:hypothetical protein